MAVTRKKARSRKRIRRTDLLDLIEKLKGSLRDPNGRCGVDVLLEERKRELENEERDLRQWGEAERRSGRPQT